MKLITWEKGPAHFERGLFIFCCAWACERNHLLLFAEISVAMDSILIGFLTASGVEFTKDGHALVILGRQPRQAIVAFFVNVGGLYRPSGGGKGKG
jgi:hypothetical protein